MSERAPRKTRGPNRPPLPEPRVTVLDTLPDPTVRRSAWVEHVNLAARNPGKWVCIGPFYRDTANGTRKRLRDAPPVDGLQVQVRHLDAEQSNVYLRVG
jgi:hypothetical protein